MKHTKKKAKKKILGEEQRKNLKKNIFRIDINEGKKGHKR